MNNNHTKSSHEALFHITKRSRDSLPFVKTSLIRCVAVILALIVSAIVIMILTKENPIKIYQSMISGAFGTERRIWNLVQALSILLCISLAVTPAFKMKFWNCGAEGQVLIGGLACVTCMFYLGNVLSPALLLVVMTIASIIAGAIWAIIPAVFKGRWNTNETLFTLMMNYIAIQLVSFLIKSWVSDGSGVLRPMHDYGFPMIFGQKYMLNAVIVAILTIVMYIYLKYSKQGYEISVVGESEKTANYIGINVKHVITRTMLLSGALCGIAGLLIVGGTDHTISTTTAGGRGFTAIMVSWLAKFNPIVMILTSFLIVFLERGAEQVSSQFRIPSAISDIITGIILFFIIGCEFFLQYKIVFSKHRKENE